MPTQKTTFVRVPASLDDVKVMRRPRMLAAVGLSRRQVDALEAKGLFPRRVVLGSRCVAWREREIAEWLAARPVVSKSPRGAAR